MITITDNPNGNQPYWEVVDSTGKLGKHIFDYDPKFQYGYDRVRVLRQIVDVYSILSGCKTQSWQIPGSVFELL